MLALSDGSTSDEGVTDRAVLIDALVPGEGECEVRTSGAIETD